MRLLHPILAATLAIAACDGPGDGGSTLGVGGSAALGIGTGALVYDAAAHGSVGPPPGRTPELRAARKAYYRGPRGEEF